MRLFVYFALIGCLSQLITESHGLGGLDVDVCVGKDDGATLYSDDPCLQCVCSGGILQCVSQSCPILPCIMELIAQPKDGECCPTCNPGCYDTYGFGYIAPGEEAVSENGCERCTCSENFELECIYMTCLVCEGHHVDDGTCCGQCNMFKCKVGDDVYDHGDIIPTENRCETCYCVADGEHIDVDCHAVACEMCDGKWSDDGTCCGRCEAKKDVCLYGDKEYELGDVIPTGNPCEECTCVRGSVIGGLALEVLCSMMMCAECIGIHVQDGSCCGQCLPITECSYDGQEYPLGIEIPSRNPCELCTCLLNGVGLPERTCAVMDCAPCATGFVRVPEETTCCGECVPYMQQRCTTVKCPALSCPERRQYKPDGECCPDCKCRYKNKWHNPGPVGGKCSGCVCKNGKVTCTPPECPAKNLECVDAELGEDCCYHCPNGKTCSYGLKLKKRVVINYGETRFIDGKICMCGGEPWLPMALCVKESVPRFLSASMRKYKNQVAERMRRP